MSMTRKSLVTGGSGYFGELLAKMLLDRDEHVRVLDLNPPGYSHPNLEFARGDIRDADTVAAACTGVDVMFHNVAQVPLAKEKALFWSVNRDGTRVLADQSMKAGVKKFVYTSSSAVFGVPRSNPVTEETPPSPAEDYGRAKLAGEAICRAAAENGLDVSIIRPRTILGHGRLGVVQILFDWIERGLDVPVLGGGNNRYQFVHSDDLAWACVAASERPGFGLYNIGAKDFGTMRELLQAVIDHADSKSRIKSIPLGPTEISANIASALGLSPLGPYHSLMYGRSMWFDISKAERELGYAPKYSNASMISETYDWYIANKATLKGAHLSHHKSPVKQQILSFLPHFLHFVPA
jgi:nucleoside-diphosphate-sugar epimerase